MSKDVMIDFPDDEKTETPNNNEEESSFLDDVMETIEELTNKIASVFGSNQDDLHDRSKWF